MLKNGKVVKFSLKIKYQIVIANSFSHLICNHFSRKVVLEKWFCKIGFFFRLEKSGSANSDFFSGSRKVVDQKKTSEFIRPSS